MKQLLVRVQKKVLLWYRFFLIADNFWQIVGLRILNMLRLDKNRTQDAVIKLSNGINLTYGKILDLSAVPVTVEIWYERIYNPDGYSIDQGDLVFDIGANVGNFAMYAVKTGASRVVAFEPVQKNYELMLKNIQNNNMPQVEAHMLAVDGDSGVVTMHMSEVDTAHSITHEAFDQQGDISVEAVTIEQFCQKHSISKIDFLKVDCEGAEYQIFEKISDQMLGLINKVAIEHHERFVHRDHKEISDRLKNAGFTVIELPDHFIFAKRS